MLLHKLRKSLKLTSLENEHVLCYTVNSQEEEATKKQQEGYKNSLF